MFKLYYGLAKPGIVYGNTLSAVAGFFFAAAGTVELGRFLGLVAGIGLVIGSACVFNNILDRRLDARMARTKQRALVNGQVSLSRAAVYGSLLGLAGFMSLALLTTAWAVLVAGLGWLAYVLVYGYAKRTTAYSTLIGSISGAAPVVVGYSAVADRLDLAALLLFIVMAAWQLPHFYAIAIFRRDDYARAKLPIWSVSRGVAATKQQIVAGVVIFGLASLALPVFGLVGWSYGLVMAVVSLVWLWVALAGRRAKDDAIWARRVFGLSLNSLLIWCLLLSLAHWLP